MNLSQDLTAYNAGYLHGVWVNAEDDVEDIQAQIRTMLRQSSVDDAGEWVIHDYSGFKGIELSEHEDLHLLSK
jgi:antirestriction protein